MSGMVRCGIWCGCAFVAGFAAGCLGASLDGALMLAVRGLVRVPGGPRPRQRSGVPPSGPAVVHPPAGWGVDATVLRALSPPA